MNEPVNDVRERRSLAVAETAPGAIRDLGDFTTTPRVIWITVLAVVIGALSAFVALALLRLIGLFTNVFFFGRLGTALVSPAGNRLGAWELLVPAAGALVIGVLARYGSERIRGHGIPEAIEAILINGSRVEPKVALLKPLASAISIGSGGPFGAEGPIIMTGGAFGSMVAQFFHLTSAERKTLLVAGASAGMSATFASPVAAVLLAVELLLFEWKPRSLVPVAMASATAAILRRYLLGIGPLFPTGAHPVFIGPAAMASCVAVGLLAGGLSALLTMAVYASEDAFLKSPIHWMWWPAIGGLVVGAGGLVFPQALGVGYDAIAALARGNVPTKLIVGLLLVKSVIWAVSLGSGTSGGVLAPLLLMGGALGGLEAQWLPDAGAGFWPLVSMGAILGGTMRSPLTGIVFTVELTHDVNLLVPLLVAVTVAHAFTALVLKRSILTEKVSRRGYHLSREYSVDPLEILFVREVMRTSVVALPPEATVEDFPPSLLEATNTKQHLFPVVDETRHLLGVLSRGAATRMLTEQRREGPRMRVSDVMLREPVVAHPDEPLRIVVFRMAETGLTRFPVVSRDRARTLLGIVALQDLLTARVKLLEAERRRERVLHLRLALRGRRHQAA